MIDEKVYKKVVQHVFFGSIYDKNTFPSSSYIEQLVPLFLYVVFFKLNSLLDYEALFTAAKLADFCTHR